MLTNLMPKNAEKFICENCNFKCCKLSNYNAHILTRKHKMLTNIDKKNAENARKFTCCCGKEYNHRQSLSVHKKKCFQKEEKIESDKITEIDNSITSELVVELMKQNKELQNTMIEQCKQNQMQMIEQNKQMIELSKNIGNNNNNTTNNKFNLNLFLNEKCKDAMNLTDFVNSIVFKLSDIDKIGEVGYVKVMTDVMVSALNSVGETKRPIHCTDVKREVIYVKDKDKWEKDENKQKIRSSLKKIDMKLYPLLGEYNNNYYRIFRSDSEIIKHQKTVEKTVNTNDDNEDEIIRNISRSTLPLKNDDLNL